MRKTILGLTVIIVFINFFLCGCTGGVLSETNGKNTAPAAKDNTEISSGVPQKAARNGLYYANVKTKIFHFNNCEAAAAIKDANLYITEYRDELVNEGYKPCTLCNP